MHSVRLVAAIAAIGLASIAAGGAPAAEAGDASRGKTIFARCAGCHSFAAGRNAAGGPSLNGVVGGPVAGQPGYRYSAAFGAYAKRHPRWTPGLLDAFIADPQRAVPGTGMLIPGVRDAKQRADLIAYLGSAGR